MSVCSMCHGRGAERLEGCIECVATGRNLTDEEWEVEYAKWELERFGPLYEVEAS